MQSPSYPGYGLSETLKMAGAIWEKERRTAVGAEVLVKCLGYNTLNGTARRKLAALRHFGFLEEVQGGDSRLSELAMLLVHGQPDSDEYKEAINKAASKPELFRELMETHASASDDAIKSNLLAKKGFSEQGARDAVASFRGTLETARLLGSAPATKRDGLQNRTKAVIPEIARRESVPENCAANHLVHEESAPQLAEASDKRVYSSKGRSATVLATVEINGKPELKDLEALQEFLEIAIKGLSRFRQRNNAAPRRTK